MHKFFANWFQRRNPSLDTVYERLEVSLVESFEHVSTSIFARHRVEEQIKKCDAQALTWLERSETATRQANESLKSMCLQRQQQYIQSSSELQELLPKLIRGNSRLLRILAKYESAVLRLYVIKALLQALRRQESEEIADFDQVAAALVSSIKKIWLSQQPDDNSLKVIVTRINDLQDHVFESYKLLMMQDDLNQLTPTDQAQFLERISKVIEDLQSKLDDSVSLWKSVHKEGTVNENELDESAPERESLSTHISNVVQMLNKLAAQLQP